MKKHHWGEGELSQWKALKIVLPQQPLPLDSESGTQSYAEYLILIASSLLAKSVIHTAYYIECGGLCLMCTYYTVCLQFG